MAQLICSASREGVAFPNGAFFSKHRLTTYSPREKAQKTKQFLENTYFQKGRHSIQKSEIRRSQLKNKMEMSHLLQIMSPIILGTLAIIK